MNNVILKVHHPVTVDVVMRKPLGYQGLMVFRLFAARPKDRECWPRSNGLLAQLFYYQWYCLIIKPAR